MIFSRSVESIIHGPFRNSTAGFLQKGRVLITCAASGGLMVFVARPVAGTKPGQVPEACCVARRASDKHRLLPGRFSTKRGNRFALGFKRCGS